MEGVIACLFILSNAVFHQPFEAGRNAIWTSIFNSVCEIYPHNPFKACPVSFTAARAALIMENDGWIFPSLKNSLVGGNYAALED
jgi:hypothetical protein